MQITILDSTGATPPEIGVCTVKIRDDAGFELRNVDSTSFAGDKRYTFNPAGTEYGMTGSFGSADVSVVDIEAFSADPPPVIFTHTYVNRSTDRSIDRCAEALKLSSQVLNENSRTFCTVIYCQRDHVECANI